MTRLGISLVAGFVCCALTQSTNATPKRSDGAYGRLDGDLALALDAGMGLRDKEPVFVASACARYLQTAGIYSTWQHRLRTQDADSSYVLSMGIEVRPMFLPRFLTDSEQGPARLDLVVDSLAFRVGTIVGASPLYSWTHPGFEGAIAVGMPLSTEAAGPWLGTSLALQVSPNPPSSVRDSSFGTALVFAVTVGWQALFAAHVVDLADRQSL